MKRIFFTLPLLFILQMVRAEIHPLYLIAEGQFKQSNFDSALINFNQLVQDFPDKKECYYNRGICLFKNKRFSEAVLDFDQCLIIDSVFVQGSYAKAISLQEMDNLKEAMYVFEQLRKMDAGIFDVTQRIQKYRFAVFISTKWYYLSGILFMLIILVALCLNLELKANQVES